MNDINRITPRILAATDFSIESERAFFHALALAVSHQARLTLLHIGPESRKEVPWERYPGVRETLTKWNKLEADSPRDAVSQQLGLGIKKMAMRDDSAYNGLLDYVRKHPTDLIVMATEARRGLARLKSASIAEGVAYATHSHALLLPSSSPSFVNVEDGSKKLERAVFVYDHEPDPRTPLGWLFSWLPFFTDGDIEVHLLYIGEEKDAPEITLPHHERLNWVLAARQGDNQRSTILEYTKEIDANLVCMMNQRSRGILGRIRGSLGEQILRRAQLPLLLIPEL